jgi:hypothetical protein
MKLDAPVAAVSLAAGAVCWWLGVQAGPGPTALNAGWPYLLILAVAGFVLGALERDLSWTAIGGLFGGQVAGLLAQAAAGTKTDLPLPFYPLFIVSVTLAAAVGGAVGSVVGRWLMPGPVRS